MLGDISAIATLILFIIYFLGRTITILMERSICYDEIVYVPVEEQNNYDIVDEVCATDHDTSMSSINSEMVILTSRQGIHNIKVFKIGYDKDFNELPSATKKIAECKFLNIGQSYAIVTYVPECIPNYRITYRTQDFKKVTLNILENRKNGIVSEMISPKHTVWSIFYYLFR